MFIVLKGDEQSSNRRYFDQLFKLRYEIFVLRRQWSLPSRNGYEIDQYDTDEAFYFLSIADDGTIEASLRMTPTVGSSLMADYFPHLNEAGVRLRAPDIYEATRYMLMPKERSAYYSRQLKSFFFARLIDWCLDQRLNYMQSVIDAGALRTFVEMSLRTQPLGLPKPFGGGSKVRGGGECLGFRWPICHELRDDFIIYGDSGARRPAQVMCESVSH